VIKFQTLDYDKNISFICTFDPKVYGLIIALGSKNCPSFQGVLVLAKDERNGAEDFYGKKG